jgi:hypothetical protein
MAVPVSYASEKAYRAEHDARTYLASQGLATERPRTTSIPGVDSTDLSGLPLVLSVKNHARMTLGAWCDELDVMVARSPWNTGVVIHKRRGAPPSRMYVTTTLELYVPMVHAHLIAHG